MHVFLETLLEHLHDVMALGIRCAESLGPTDEHTVVNLVLSIEDLVTAYVEGRGS